MNEKIIKRIKELIEINNMTINELAIRSSIHSTVLYELISGRTKEPKVSTIEKLCKTFGITLSEFFDKEYFN